MTPLLLRLLQCGDLKDSVTHSGPVGRIVKGTEDCVSPEPNRVKNMIKKKLMF